MSEKLGHFSNPKIFAGFGSQGWNCIFDFGPPLASWCIQLHHLEFRTRREHLRFPSDYDHDSLFKAPGALKLQGVPNSCPPLQHFAGRWGRSWRLMEIINNNFAGDILWNMWRARSIRIYHIYSYLIIGNDTDGYLYKQLINTWGYDPFGVGSSPTAAENWKTTRTIWEYDEPVQVQLVPGFSGRAWATSVAPVVEPRFPWAFEPAVPNWFARSPDSAPNILKGGLRGDWGTCRHAQNMAKATHKCAIVSFYQSLEAKRMKLIKPLPILYPFSPDTVAY